MIAAAVEEQTIATSQISQSVDETAAKAQSIAANITALADAATASKSRGCRRSLTFESAAFRG
ncbi:MAG: hypothetical protein R2770_05450 [Acidimicrobiales bacterium]